MSPVKPTIAEEIMDPAQPIVDAHHHLIYGHGNRYLLDEYLSDIRTGHNIIATVYVESRAMVARSGPPHLRPVGETEFATGIAAMTASGNFGDVLVCNGIVSFADLSAPDVGELLDAHQRVGGERFKGIRHATLWDEDTTYQKFSVTRSTPGMMMSDQFRAGFGELAKRRLSFDACLFHPQIPELVDLASRFPDVTIVLNHLGFPLGIGRYAGKRDEVFQHWKRSMAELAQCPNVRVKIGGMGMPMFGFDLHEREVYSTSDQLAALWSPYVLETIEAFGVGRCLAESNFPPDRVSVSYPAVWNALKRVVAQFGASERERFFGRNAIETYRLSVEYPIVQVPDATPHARE